jgi:hypothetical protein
MRVNELTIRILIVFSILITSIFIQQNIVYALNGNATTNTNIENTGFLVYQNDKAGIQIQYPPGSHVREIA